MGKSTELPFSSVFSHTIPGQDSPERSRGGKSRPGWSAAHLRLAQSPLPRGQKARQELGFHNTAALQFIAAARCNDIPAPRAAGSVPRAGNSAGILQPRCAAFHLPAGLRAPIPAGNATGISCATGGNRLIRVCKAPGDSRKGRPC